MFLRCQLILFNLPVLPLYVHTFLVHILLQNDNLHISVKELHILHISVKEFFEINRIGHKFASKDFRREFVKVARLILALFTLNHSSKLYTFQTLICALPIFREFIFFLACD